MQFSGAAGQMLTKLAQNKTAALEARTAVQFLPGEDGQLACF